MRDNRIDQLRSICIFGIFFMHVSLSFTTIPYQFDFWPFHVSSPSLTLSGLCSFINTTSIPILFYLAGTSALKHFIDGNKGWFLNRLAKWFTLFLISYVCCVIVVDQLISVFEPRVKWYLVVFPPNSKGFLLNLMHLWFLVVLMFSELTAFIFIYLHKRINQIPINRNQFAFAVFLLHFIVVCCQRIGYLEAPYFFTMNKILPMIVFMGYYFLGMIYPPSSLNIKPNGLLVLCISSAYFGMKYTTLEIYGNTHLFQVSGLVNYAKYDSVLHVVNSLLEASLVFCCLGYYFAKVPFFDKMKSNVDFINRHAILIYILQIPVIFSFFIFIHSIMKLNLQSLKFLHAEPKFNINVNPIELSFLNEIQPWIAAMVSLTIIALLLVIVIKVTKSVLKN